MLVITSLFLIPVGTMYANLVAKLRFLFKTVSLKDHIPLSITAPDRGLTFSVYQSKRDSVFFKNNKSNLP